MTRHLQLLLLIADTVAAESSKILTEKLAAFANITCDKTNIDVLTTRKTKQFDVVVIFYESLGSEQVENLLSIGRIYKNIPFVAFTERAESVAIEQLLRAGLQDIIFMHEITTTDLQRHFRYAIERQKFINNLKTLFTSRQDFLLSHDPTTGLANQRLLLKTLNDYLGHSEGRHYAILFINLRSVRTVNMRMGHVYGDALIRTIAQRMSKSLARAKFVARYAASEFVIILSNVLSQGDVVSCVRELQDVLTEPLTLLDRQHYPTCNIGIVMLDHHVNADMLLRQAHAAANKAMRQGPNTYAFFAKGDIDLESKLPLESDLLLALQNKEFYLRYQPIVSLETNNIVGVEALLRWQMPDNRDMPPEIFVPLAESSGVMPKIGSLIVTQALENFKSWRESQVVGDDFIVSINVSSTQLHTRDFIELITAQCERHLIPRANIQLELTESVFFDANSKAYEHLQNLHDIGFKIAIDDFGTGYSSFSYVMNLPIDKVKMDRSFIDNYQDKVAYTVLESIIDMSHSLGYTIVAEGVDSEAKLELLRKLGCDEGQGFYYGKPLLSDELIMMMKN